jgi:phage baseplate assembly protein W
VTDVDLALLGRGWAFPIKVVPDQLRTFLGGDEKIRQSIWIILSTTPGERQMRPEFGCSVHDLVFEPNAAGLRALVRARVQEALTRWEPRIDVLDVRVDTPPPDERHVLLIRIDYRTRSNNTAFNLTFPLFLDEGVG